jgi:hypothetical protein
MAETREKSKHAADTALGMAEKAEELGNAGTQAAKEKLQAATSGVVGAVKDKAQDMADSASQLAVKVKDTAEEWVSSVGDAAVQVKGKAQEVARATAHEFGELNQEVIAWVRRYPLPALLVGVGAGFLLAQILRRPSSAEK